MAVAATRVTVATTGGGTEIYTNDNGPTVDVNVRNRGAVAVYIGAPNLTTSTGYQLDPGEAVGMELQQGDELYGITASSTCVVHVLKVRG